MGHDLIAVAGERDAACPCPTCPWVDAVSRDEVFQCREVQTIRAPVPLQPGRTARTNGWPGMASWSCGYATTPMQPVRVPEVSWQQQVEPVGGHWNRCHQVWGLYGDQVVALKWTAHIGEEQASNTRYHG